MVRVRFESSQAPSRRKTSQPNKRPFQWELEEEAALAEESAGRRRLGTESRPATPKWNEKSSARFGSFLNCTLAGWTPEFNAKSRAKFSSLHRPRTRLRRNRDPLSRIASEPRRAGAHFAEEEKFLLMVEEAANEDSRNIRLILRHLT